MLLTVACHRPDDLAEKRLIDSAIPTPPELPNLMLVLLDDVGTDKIAAYGEHPNPPPTATLSALAAEGVLFRNAWAAPTCAPSRGMLLTGRYGRRYGLGENPGLLSEERIPPRELYLPQILAESPREYTSAALGKWGIVGFGNPGLMSDPLDHGFATHIGSPANVVSYFQWLNSADGVLTGREGYLTTATIDDAIALMPTLPEPWFLYLAPNAAHSPVHPPPDPLNPSGVTETDPLDEQYDAVLTALDIELGRMLGAMDPDVRARTVIIVMGDNGTPDFAITAPFDPTHGKVSMYEGGINVPLIVVGPVVEAPGTESAALVNVVDVTATLTDIAQVDLSALTLGDGTPYIADGTSFLPQLRDPNTQGRPFNYIEYLADNGPPPWPKARNAVRNARYKFVSYTDPVLEQLFDLSGRNDDGPDLLLEPLVSEAESALTQLRAEMARIETEASYLPP